MSGFYLHTVPPIVMQLRVGSSAYWVLENNHDGVAIERHIHFLEPPGGKDSTNVVRELAVPGDLSSAIMNAVQNWT